MILRRFIVSGKVQGVYFRQSTREQAVRLGLRGFAANLADGSVDVVAQGRAEALEELRLWLHQGPPQARVDAVSEVSLEPLVVVIPQGFETR
jgi:acylphosphatase